MSDSVRPHRRQPIRLPRPWDSPGKSTGVGCHFLLQCMKVKSESEVAQLCPIPSDPRDCSPPGSSVHGIFQARVLEGCHRLLLVRMLGKDNRMPWPGCALPQLARFFVTSVCCGGYRPECGLGSFPGFSMFSSPLPTYINLPEV